MEFIGYVYFEDLFGVEVWIHIQPRSTKWTTLLEQVCDDDVVEVDKTMIHEHVR